MKGLSVSKTGVYKLRKGVPPDVRHIIGQREFKVSLGKVSRPEADAKALSYLSDWEHKILDAREQVKFIAAPERPRRTIGIAVDAHLEEYKQAQLAHLKERSIADHVRSLENHMFKRFPVIHNRITQRVVQGWVDSYQELEHPPASRTLEKYVNCASKYMSWLIRKGYAPPPNYFSEVEMPLTRRMKRQPFSDDEILLIYRNIEDEELSNLFLLGAYTGCRIEELCQLTAEDVLPYEHEGKERVFFIIRNAKTAAGQGRTVPVHLQIHALVLRLQERGGYLIHTPTTNKYKERSSAIGKRFGRLKRELGFGPEKVFHSLRKTVATQFKNQGIPEPIAADILGHELQTMSYGVYAGGAPLNVLFETLDQIDYKDLEGATS
ncbi:MAG: tyrosine-type recombinase/integrase [Pseudomonadales bacterium]